MSAGDVQEPELDLNEDKSMEFSANMFVDQSSPKGGPRPISSDAETAAGSSALVESGAEAAASNITSSKGNGMGARLKQLATFGLDNISSMILPRRALDRGELQGVVEKRERNVLLSARRGMNVDDDATSSSPKDRKRHRAGSPGNEGHDDETQTEKMLRHHLEREQQAKRFLRRRQLDSKYAIQCRMARLESRNESLENNMQSLFAQELSVREEHFHSNIERQKAELGAATEEQKNATIEAEARLRGAQERIRDMEQEISGLTEKLSTAAAEGLRLQETATKAYAAQRQIQRKCTKTELALAEANNIAQAAADRVSALEQAKKDSDARVLSLETETRTLQDGINNRDNELAEALDHSRSLMGTSQELEAMTQMHRSKASQVITLLEKNKKLLEEIHGLTMELDALTDTHDQDRAALDESQGALHALRASFAETESSRKSLVEEVERLKSKLKEAEAKQKDFVELETSLAGASPRNQSSFSSKIQSVWRWPKPVASSPNSSTSTPRPAQANIAPATASDTEDGMQGIDGLAGGDGDTMQGVHGIGRGPASTPSGPLEGMHEGLFTRESAAGSAEHSTTGPLSRIGFTAGTAGSAFGHAGSSRQPATRPLSGPGLFTEDGPAAQSPPAASLGSQRRPTDSSATSQPLPIPGMRYYKPPKARQPSKQSQRAQDAIRALRLEGHPDPEAVVNGALSSTSPNLHAPTGTIPILPGGYLPSSSTRRAPATESAVERFRVQQEQQASRADDRKDEHNDIQALLRGFMKKKMNITTYDTAPYEYTGATDEEVAEFESAANDARPSSPVWYLKGAPLCKWNATVASMLVDEFQAHVADMERRTGLAYARRTDQFIKSQMLNMFTNIKRAFSRAEKEYGPELLASQNMRNLASGRRASLYSRRKQIVKSTRQKHRLDPEAVQIWDALERCLLNAGEEAMSSDDEKEGYEDFYRVRTMPWRNSQFTRYMQYIDLRGHNVDSAKGTPFRKRKRTAEARETRRDPWPNLNRFFYSSDEMFREHSTNEGPFQMITFSLEGGVM